MRRNNFYKDENKIVKHRERMTKSHQNNQSISCGSNLEFKIKLLIDLLNKFTVK